MISRVQNNVKAKNRILYSKVSLIVILIALGFILFTFCNSYLKRAEIKSEIDNLNTEISYLESKNQNFNNLISYLESDDYVEFESKRKLGMKKIGENSVVITDLELNKLMNNEISNSKINENGAINKVGFGYNKDNYLLWLEYFFNNI